MTSGKPRQEPCPPLPRVVPGGSVLEMRFLVPKEAACRKPQVLSQDGREVLLGRNR